MDQEAIEKLLGILEGFDDRITALEKEVEIGWGSDLHTIHELRDMLIK